MVVIAESRIVIWDVDGNLYASLEGYLENYLERLMEYKSSRPNRFTRQYILTKKQLELAREYYEGRGGGTPIEIQIPAILEELGFPKEDGFALVAKWHQENETKVYPVYPDVIPCLQTLKETGYRQCASTNTHQHILDRRITENNLHPYLDVWFGGTAEFGRASDGKRVNAAVHKKTHKDPIMAFYGLTDEQFRQGAVLIGDTSGDGRVAKEWGCRGFIYRIRPETDVDTPIDKIRERVIEQGANPFAIVRYLNERTPELLDELFSSR